MLFKLVQNTFIVNTRRYSTVSRAASILPSTRITEPLEKRLIQLTQRHDSLLNQLNDNTLNSKELTEASKELSTLSSVHSLFTDWQKGTNDLVQLHDLLSHDSKSEIREEQDEEMLELAKEEFTEITERLKQVEKELITELAPKDMADEASAILEIRAGAGGDEAALFSVDMSRMYERFAQLHRWKWEILAKSEDAGLKGIKEMTVNIAGRNVFGLLKYESGVHRVQRVPSTESQGRIHTSTITVAILPQPTEVDVQIKDSDLRIDVYRASGAGGQHVNTTDSAVRMTHIPTGLVVAMQDERSQHKNKAKALKVLRAKIYEMEREKTNSARRNSRNKQIGSGDRSEKIRTYNFPQNRVTDHRINLTLYELEPILSGDGLSRVIEPLQEHYLSEIKGNKLFMISKDEGFASSSSQEEGDLTAEIIQRKRAQRQSKRLGISTLSNNNNQAIHGMTTTNLEQQQQQDYSAINVTAAPFEKLLWISSFAWAMWKGKELFVSFSLTVYTARVQRIKPESFSMKKLSTHSATTTTTTPFTTTSSDTLDSETSPRSSIIYNKFTLKRKNNQQQQQQQAISKTCLGLFGAGKSSFRSDADDGLLCGVFLLPMVGIAKMINVTHKNHDIETDRNARMHGRLELILLMTLIFLILVLANRFLQPMRRIIRKRGLFVSSIIISIAFTHGISRLTPLTPILNRIPISIIAIPITTFQWALYTCTVALKRCFTLGEMCILSEAIAMLVYNSMEYIFTTMFPDRIPSFIKNQELDNVSILLHAVILGILFIGAISYPLLKQSRHLAQQPYWRTIGRPSSSSNNNNNHCITIGIIIFMIAPICKTLMNHQDPFLWTLSFVFLSPQRLFLCIYWALTVATTVIVWVLVLDFTVSDGPVEAKVLTSALNKKRKLFHALAVIMFIPGVLFELPFLQLAFGVALGVFIYLEYLRYFAIWPYGKSIHMFLSEFIDSRDLGPVILSHIYLLLGCAGPVWLGGSNLLASLSGIIALGFGDAAASLVGKKWGRYRWPGTKKTVEGTMAFVFA
ncbi:hypothetical protein INT45_004615 [Circinella minor]|uniref:Prokaryotic-type class I peptide chain release factors domain-containing protein n=1 Tax=Circinella minor TaxID=1195481 RepID=A0A8H7S3R9_9FUNG|nr:hypothetical protein INT45_004615 [Circinella minor]